MSRPSHLPLAPATAAGDWTELALREGDGLEISLHWSSASGRIKVCVLDQRHEESFDIHVARDQALNAFYHPFAYASGAATCFRGDPRAAADLHAGQGSSPAPVRRRT